MPIKDYEDVTVYGLDADTETELISQQNECTFVWTTADGSPMAVIMSYLEKDGKFWMTASGQRKRIPAIRRDPRVAIVIHEVHGQKHRRFLDRRGDDAEIRSAVAPPLVTLIGVQPVVNFTRQQAQSPLQAQAGVGVATSPFVAHEKARNACAAVAARLPQEETHLEEEPSTFHWVTSPRHWAGLCDDLEVFDRQHGARGSGGSRW